MATLRFSFIIFILMLSQLSFGLDFKSSQQKPKLVLVLVIDQFRADYLTRFQADFLPPGNSQAPGGFRFLMEKGAYFPFAEYDVLQNMTCPGHAMILTGARPVLNGITTNDWYDRESARMTYCAEDLVDGISPRKLLSTTVGDELKNVNEAAKVYTVSLKDRAAVMLGGHRADLALWFDTNKWAWGSSTYYLKTSPPVWLNQLNQKVIDQAKNQKEQGKKLMSTEFGVKATVDAALTVLRENKMGKGRGTDMLAISFSSHDMLGHVYGPNSQQLASLTVAEDHEMARLLRGISAELGSLENVTIALTADHGIPPVPDTAKQWKYEAGKFDYLQVFKRLNQHLDQKFGMPANKEWITYAKFYHLYLNQKTLEEKKLSSAQVEAEIKSVLEKEAGVMMVLTKSDYLAGHLPVGLLGEQIRHSYLPQQGGDLIVIPRPYYMEKDDNNVTHVTGWSYDRTVPLILVGRNVKAGIYAGAKVIDLASTLSFLLMQLSPSMNEGRVLSEIIK